MATVFQFPYRTVAEVSLPALVRNLYTLRNLCRKEIIPVIKADAYGHGMIQVAKVLVNRGSCLTLAVATLEEALELRKKIPHGVSILVLSGFLPHQIEAYTRYKLVPVVHSLHHLKSLVGRKHLPELHLKLDTGMHRLGILPDQIAETVKTLEKMAVKLAGVTTHFAESEVTISEFTDQQIDLFAHMHAQLAEKRLINTDAKIHIGNSGAVLRNKLGFSNAVRPGLALYGVSSNPRLPASDQLIPVMEWKARILAMKDLKRNDTVGYNRTYKAKKRERLAILPIGYADGYPRLLSNVGEVLLSGKRLPVRGRVSMDLTTVDATGNPNAKEGAIVTLMGKSGKDEISAWEIAGWAQTIPYEIFCGISARVSRVYFD